MVTQYVLGFLFSEDRQYVALIRKQKPKWQEGLLNGVGGKVEPNEFSQSAMEREFLEETGVIFNSWIPRLHLHGPKFNMMVYSGFDDCVADVKTQEAEQVDLYEVWKVLGSRWDTVSNLRWIIPFLLDDEINFYNIPSVEYK